MSGWTTAELYGDDATSVEGAHRIKQRIERYWREQGYEVHVTLRRLRYSSAARQATVALESDMINGLPREAFHKQREGQAA